MSDKDYRDILKGQLKVSRILQEYEMDFRTWEVLILIALDEGEGAINLANKYNISKSAFSRHVLFLCGERTTRANHKDRVENDKEKLPSTLVEKRNSATDSRRQNLYVTREGENFIRKIYSLIEG